MACVRLAELAFMDKRQGQGQQREQASEDDGLVPIVHRDGSPLMIDGKPLRARQSDVRGGGVFGIHGAYDLTFEERFPAAGVVLWPERARHALLMLPGR